MIRPLDPERSFMYFSFRLRHISILIITMQEVALFSTKTQLMIKEFLTNILDKLEFTIAGESCSNIQHSVSQNGVKFQTHMTTTMMILTPK
jgi:hypothetical protein